MRKEYAVRVSSLGDSSEAKGWLKVHSKSHIIGDSNEAQDW